MCTTTPTLFRKKCSKEEKFLECIQPAEGSPPDLEPHSQPPQALHAFGGFVLFFWLLLLFCSVLRKGLTVQPWLALNSPRSEVRGPLASASLNHCWV